MLITTNNKFYGFFKILNVVIINLKTKKRKLRARNFGRVFLIILPKKLFLGNIRKSFGTMQKT